MTTNPYESSKTTESSTQPPVGNSPGLLTIAFRVVSGIVVLLLLGALLLPFNRGGAREAARRMQCQNHLRQIALALLNYESDHGCLPPAYTIDPSGKPLHSWRTLILPYLEQKALYAQIDLSKPWNDPVNQAAHDTSLSVYHCPSSSARDNTTTYFAIVAPGSCFKATEPSSLAAIKDGRNLTLMLIECPTDQAVHWMAPSDADENLILALNDVNKPLHTNGVHAAFVSGRVQHLPANLKPEYVRALITIAGNDKARADY